MPILHLQFNVAQQKAPDGSITQVPPTVALLQRGPCIQVSLSLPEVIAQQLLQQGQTLPPPITGLALIDTGATVTCVDDGAARQLQLPVIDVAHMSSASHAATQQNVYPLLIEVIGPSIRIDIDRVMGANLAAQGLIALIGRDFLQHCTLFYNGPSGSITLSL